MPPFALGAHAPLSPAELTAAVLDGDLEPVSRTAYGVAARPHHALVRASAARTVMPSGHAAVRTTAAWIHGALDHEPEPHHVQLLAGAPVRRHWALGLVAHTWPLPLSDATDIGGVPVATLERTCYDVARAVITGPHDPFAVRSWDWFRSRADLHPVLIAWLSQGRRLTYTKQIAQLLREAHA